MDDGAIDVDDDASAGETGNSIPRTTACPGVTLDIAEPKCNNYPLALQSMLQLPYSITFDHTDATLVAKDCAKKATDDGGACDKCGRLLEKPIVQNIVERANDPLLHLSHCSNAYLSAEQMKRRYHRQVEKQSKLKLKLLHQTIKVQQLQQKVDDWKKIQVALSASDVPRLRVLMAQMVRVRCRAVLGCDFCLTHTRVFC